MDKVQEWFDAHPKVVIALAGALVAVKAYEMYEACRWLSEAVVKTHLAAVADETARAASEALGG